jgi:hypothetical protein
MFNEVLFCEGPATSLEDQDKFLLLGADLQLLSTTRASVHLKPQRLATRLRSSDCSHQQLLLYPPNGIAHCVPSYTDQPLDIHNYRYLLSRTFPPFSAY